MFFAAATRQVREEKDFWKKRKISLARPSGAGYYVLVPPESAFGDWATPRVSRRNIFLRLSFFHHLS
jgi:hypothetical protein